MNQTRSKKPLVAAGVMALGVAAYFQIPLDPEDDSRKAAKVTLQVTSDGTRAGIAYGIDALPGPRKTTTLVRDESVDTNSWRQTVIVPKGKKVILIAERIDRDAVCWIIYRGVLADNAGTIPTGQALCQFTPA